ncbi:MAG: hypothetical protein JNK60_14820 [Acidobacteria bacterium]|nr:hypothetical protein [Acidobacteriota bacterium]
MSRALVCAIALLTGACAASNVRTSPVVATYRAVDLMPDFWEFWSAAEKLPADEQAKLFEKTLVVKHPEVYKASVLGLDEAKPFGETLARRFERWLPMMTPHVPTMRVLSKRIAIDLPRYESTFRKAFPDFAYDGEVYFLNSLGAFDGGTRTVKGRTALLFGVDMIAYVYGETDPQAFFHHELFHIHHSRIFPNEGATPLWEKLWQEGLAEHVAKTLNPAADGVLLFGLPADMPERARRILPELARELSESLDDTSKETYARYFLGSTAQGERPPRSGYYVGYLVARHVAGDRPLREVAVMKGPKLRAAIANALEEIVLTPP